MDNAHETETTQTTVTEDVIDLGVGHPGLSLLPVDLLAASTRAAFERGDPRMLQYGYEQGAGEFREALAGFLERTTGIPLAPSGLFISGGVSQALDLLSSLFTRPGDLVFVEEPTYFLALRIFADYGLRVRSIPTDAEGLDVDALTEALGEETPVFLYTIPVHQNPSGVTMSEARRVRLVELAEEHDFLVLADEVYQLLTYDGAAPRPFGRFIDTGRVCALGSFSKILAPGLRMGWISAHGEILRRIVGSGFLDSGGGLAPFSSALLHAAVADGSLERHIEALRRAYRARRDALLTALGAPAGDGGGAALGAAGGARRPGGGETPPLRVAAPHGGYFVWAELPEGRSAAEVLPRAREAGVAFVPGPRFSATESLSRYLRISFSYYEPRRIAEGARRLLSVL
ncbi:MAG: PLP-dependent aminotransferase family protein [Spirochaetaceae bacterium]